MSIVIPAKAGIQKICVNTFALLLDSRLRGNDGVNGYDKRCIGEELSCQENEILPDSSTNGTDFFQIQIRSYCSFPSVVIWVQSVPSSVRLLRLGPVSPEFGFLYPCHPCNPWSND